MMRPSLNEIIRNHYKNSNFRSEWSKVCRRKWEGNYRHNAVFKWANDQYTMYVFHDAWWALHRNNLILVVMFILIKNMQVCSMPEYKVRDAHAEWPFCAGDAVYFSRATRRLQRICRGRLGENNREIMVDKYMHRCRNRGTRGPWPPQNL